MEDPLLHELLEHYGLLEYEDSLVYDQFGVENFLQIKSEGDFSGFFEHYDVQGFLQQNRFKTMIAAIPALKRTNRLPTVSERSKKQAFPSSQMVPFGGTFPGMTPGMPPMGMNPMMMNPMMGQMGMNPMMNPMMGQMGMNPMMGQMGMNPMMGQMNPLLSGMNQMNINPQAAMKTKKKSTKPIITSPLSPSPLVPESKEVDEDDPFATEEARDGEQFASIKPWVGTVTATKPDNAPSNNPSAPDAQLQIDWIYGFKCDSRQTILIDGRGRIIFGAASVLVAFDVNNHTQQHYKGPSDEIQCMAQSPVDANLIAVGQCASLTDDKKSEDPFITIFDLAKNTTVRLPSKHKRNIGVISFSNDGNMIASNGQDDNFTILVWDWKNKKVLAEDKAVNRTPMLSCAWNTKVVNEFVGVGKGTVAFYQVTDGKLKSLQAKFEVGTKDTTFICCAYTEKGTAIVGTKDGSVYAFVGSTCQKVFEKIHEGPVHTLFSCPEGIVTAGNGVVKVNGSKFETLASFNTGTGGARSVFMKDKALVMGTNLCEMYYTPDFISASQPTLIHTGHCDGELWAVSPHPDASSGIFASVGEDNKLMIWNSISHTLIKSGPVSTDPAAAARKIQRAATSSSYATNYCARAITWSPNGKHIAIGTNEGKCAVYDSTTLNCIALIDLNSFGKANNKNPEHWIQCISYSPNGATLAVGTHGSVIVLLDVNDNYIVKEKLTAHNSAITCLDWSLDSKNIQSVCLGYELLFHDIVSGLKGSKQEKSASKLKNQQWATQTCKFGWYVNGIFRPGQEGFRIASVDRSISKDLIATGEDTGKINLFRNPCNSEGNAFVGFAGHASHITCVRFFPDDQSLVSAGGNDKCIFQWKVNRN